MEQDRFESAFLQTVADSHAVVVVAAGGGSGMGCGNAVAAAAVVVVVAVGLVYHILTCFYCRKNPTAKSEKYLIDRHTC